MKKEKAHKKWESRKLLMISAFFLIAGICAALIILKFAGGEEKIGVEVCEKNEMPQEIAAEIIPEYKTLERALACKVDDDIYVIVTRGEKPTSGFRVSVKKIAVEHKDNKENLIVYALFEDPQKKTALSQIITYPAEVVKTELKTLPDTIELRIQY